MKLAGTVLLNAIGIGGIVSITYGAWLIFEPAGFIVGGGFAFAAALMLDR